MVARVGRRSDGVPLRGANRLDGRTTARAEWGDGDQAAATSWRSVGDWRFRSVHGAACLGGLAADRPAAWAKARLGFSVDRRGDSYGPAAQGRAWLGCAAVAPARRAAARMTCEWDSGGLGRRRARLECGAGAGCGGSRHLQKGRRRSRTRDRLCAANGQTRPIGDALGGPARPPGTVVGLRCGDARRFRSVSTTPAADPECSTCVERQLPQALGGASSIVRGSATPLRPAPRSRRRGRYRRA